LSPFRFTNPSSSARAIASSGGSALPLQSMTRVGLPIGASRPSM
jgi:hypothetical protein